MEKSTILVCLSSLGNRRLWKEKKIAWKASFPAKRERGVGVEGKESEEREVKTMSSPCVSFLPRVTSFEAQEVSYSFVLAAVTVAQPVKNGLNVQQEISIRSNGAMQSAIDYFSQVKCVFVCLLLVSLKRKVCAKRQPITSTQTKRIYRQSQQILLMFAIDHKFNSYGTFVFLLIHLPISFLPFAMRVCLNTYNSCTKLVDDHI